MSQHTIAKTKRPTGENQQWNLPAANIYQAGESYRLELEMPGVNKDGLEITVEGQELTITGHRSDTNLPGESIHRESRSIDFRRIFSLDPAIDTEKITARLDQGIATLVLPKADKIKPRKITVSD